MTYFADKAWLYYHSHMVNPNSIIGQIGESFETLAKDVVDETVNVPKDIMGKVLESGTSQPKQQKQQAPQEQKDEQEKKVVARAALEEISGKGKPQQKEPTVWEKIQKEEEEKKNIEQKNKAEAAKQALPKGSSKKARGDLYGMKAKKAAAEMSRNVRQD